MHDTEFSPQGFQRFITGRTEAAEAAGAEYAYTSDRVTRAAFDRLPPLQLVVEAAVRSFWHLQVGQLLGHAVKVGPRQFTRVSELLNRAAATLGIAAPELYVVSSPHLNAATYGTRDHSFIIVHSALIDHLSDEELLSVIGHECGHIHNQHVTYLTALKVLEGLGGRLSAFVSLGVSLSLKAWSRRAEITCDRAALLCTRDLDVATRALTKLALGSRRLYEELDVEVFLEQHAELRANAGRYSEMFSTHPWLPKRVLALRLFAESEVYQGRLGLSGGKRLTEVDAEVERLVKVVG